MHKLKFRSVQYGPIMSPLSRLLRSTRLDREHGQVLPMFALMVFAIMGMTGVVVDGGNLFQNKQALQNAADASAIGAGLYLADSSKTCVANASDPIGSCAGQYATLNSANGPRGDSSAPQYQCTTASPDACALPVCNTANPASPLYVTDTQGPSQAPGCYVYPYNNGQIEVWLTRKTSNFFGGLFGLSTSTMSARGVGTPVPGPAPAISFAALDHTAACDNHTLLVKLGGNLVVHSGIYVNSCSQGDAFDIFNGGSISAPKIETNGGWESHNSSKVYVPAGTLCSFTKNSGGTDWHIVAGPPPTYSPTPAGCPDIGQAPIADPFAGFPPAPTLGPGHVGPGVTITKISRGANGRAANIADVFTSGADGLSVNDLVTISGVGSGFDGTYTVQATPASNEFTYDNSAGSDGCGTAPCANAPAITNEQMTGGTATLTTNAPDTLASGDSVTVSGLNVNGLQPFFNVANAIVTGTGFSSFSFASPLASRQFNVTPNVGLSNGTATLHLNSVTGLAIGDTVSVSGLTGTDATLNGSFTLTGVAGGNITYAVNATQNLAVTGRSIAGATMATITTANTHTFASGDSVTVNTGDSRFDNGGNNVTATGGSGPGTLKYTIAAITASLTNAAAAGGNVVLTLGTFPGFESGDTVALPGGLGTAYGSGNVTLTNASSGAQTISYAAPTLTEMGMASRTGTTVTFQTMGAANGLKTGDTVNISGFPAGQSCFNVGNTTVTVTNSTTFTFTVPATCLVNGGSGKVSLVASSGAAASGNVTLQTTPSLGAGGNVTVFVSIASGAPTPNPCNGCVTLTDVPSTAASGTFTPAWMPTFGVMAKNLVGSPGIPSPDEIPTGTVTLNPGTYYGGICIGAASGSSCVGTNCAAAGGTTTTIQSYPTVVKLTADVAANFDGTGGIGPIQVNTTGPINPGDVIAIDDEEMKVNSVDSTTQITVTREWNGTEDAMHTSGTEVKKVVTTQNATAYSPAVTVNAPGPPAPGGLTANQTTVPIQWPGQATVDPVQVNDVIQIGSEDMLVTAETVAAGSKATLTVTRNYFNTAAATHPNGAAVLNASTGAAANVTLSPGVYIMAGGGFSVCGAASLSAPDVMIYNTVDSAHNAGNGALGQVDINTAGNVHLGPMNTGIYAGMTIFQDRSQTLVGGACDGKSGNSTQWDIALQSAAPLPASGELGSISGTIYAPNYGADFGDTMSGTANLAVITSCIYINGANSTFNFDPSNYQLAGPASATLGG